MRKGEIAKALTGDRGSYYSHFTDKETEAQRVALGGVWSDGRLPPGCTLSPTHQPKHMEQSNKNNINK